MISSYRVIIFGISLASASVLRRSQSTVSPPSLTLTNNPIPPSVVENTSLPLSSITYVCGDNYYGSGAFANSCDEAVRTMAVVPGPAAHQFTWGERDMGHYDIPLPQRWYSSDGLCYIEMELVNGQQPALASQSQVVAGAETVIDGCIRGNEDPKGGLAENISECVGPDLHVLRQQVLNVVFR